MTEAEKYFKEWSKSRKHGFTLINPTWVGIAFTEKEMIDFAQSYKDHCIASITDEMIENEIDRFLPIAIKNKNGKLVNPFKNTFAYQKTKLSMLVAFKELLNKNS